MTCLRGFLRWFEMMTRIKISHACDDYNVLWWWCGCNRLIRAAEYALEEDCLFLFVVDDVNERMFAIEDGRFGRSARSEWKQYRSSSCLCPLFVYFDFRLVQRISQTNFLIGQNWKVGVLCEDIADVHSVQDLKQIKQMLFIPVVWKPFCFQSRINNCCSLTLIYFSH